MEILRLPVTNGMPAIYFKLIGVSFFLYIDSDLGKVSAFPYLCLCPRPETAVFQGRNLSFPQPEKSPPL